jgi:hypothetical protein
LTLRRQNHARIFKCVLKIVSGNHGGKLWCPLIFSKDTDEE